tara:strand:- start:15309 stop:15533 length:225 start_codon:yes stop_codon:yes gene_type:complete
MKNLLWEVKYELTRTLKHVFYVLLAVCWFAIWYGIFWLITGELDIRLWHDGIQQMYVTISVFTGLGYMLYRSDT